MKHIFVTGKNEMDKTWMGFSLWRDEYVEVVDPFFILCSVNLVSHGEIVYCMRNIKHTTANV